MAGHETMEARLTQIVERLRPLRPHRIVLFGSAARGRADALSDLDIIVVADVVPARFVDRIGQALALVDPDYALDILVYTPEEYERMIADENPLVMAAVAEGKTLYARPAA